MQEKSSRLETFKRFVKGDWSILHTELVDENGKIKDGHPLEGILIVFRITGKDESKNSIRQIGNSNYLLINKATKELGCNKNRELKNPILHGYNEINNHRYLVVDCGIKGGEEQT